MIKLILYLIMVFHYVSNNTLCKFFDDSKMSNFIKEFEKSEILGKGSYGVTKKMILNIDGQVGEYAVKFIKVETEINNFNRKKQTDKIAQEFWLLKNLKINSFVKFFECYQNEKMGYFFLITEILQSISDYEISQPFLTKNPDPIQRLYKYAQIFQDLHEFHKKGWIHNDIKIQNLMMNQGGDLIIIDLGVSQSRTEPCIQEEGTLFYFSPQKSIVQIVKEILYFNYSLFYITSVKNFFEKLQNIVFQRIYNKELLKLVSFKSSLSFPKNILRSHISYDIWSLALTLYQIEYSVDLYLNSKKFQNCLNQNYIIKNVFSERICQMIINEVFEQFTIDKEPYLYDIIASIFSYDYKDSKTAIYWARLIREKANSLIQEEKYSQLNQLREQKIDNSITLNKKLIFPTDTDFFTEDRGVCVSNCIIFLQLIQRF